MNVKKIIELNGDYTCRFDGEISHGYGNIRIFYAHIYAYEDKGVYKVWVYNTNEYGRKYLPHRDYIYTCRRGEGIYLTYPDGDTIKINEEELTVPYGWDNAKKEKLRDILESLK